MHHLVYSRCNGRVFQNAFQAFLAIIADANRTHLLALVHFLQDCPCMQSLSAGSKGELVTHREGRLNVCRVCGRVWPERESRKQDRWWWWRRWWWWCVCLCVCLSICVYLRVSVCICLCLCYAYTQLEEIGYQMKLMESRHRYHSFSTSTRHARLCAVQHRDSNFSR